MIHKCENEHKCRSVRDDESDSEKVRLWLCRIDDEAPDDDAEGVDALVAPAVVVVVAVLALALEDELAAADERLLSMVWSRRVESSSFSYISKKQLI